MKPGTLITGGRLARIKPVGSMYVMENYGRSDRCGPGVRLRRTHHARAMDNDRTDVYRVGRMVAN